MRNYSSTEIEDYVATGDPLDKAGSYAIQHPDFQPVKDLAGCYATVVGLPLCHLVRSLGRLGVKASGEVPSSCQEYHEYQCPVFKQILGYEGEFGAM